MITDPGQRGGTVRSGRSIHPTAIISPDAQLYGAVDVGAMTIIEGSVSIGHPTPAEISGALNSKTEGWSSPEELYATCSQSAARLGSFCVIRSGTVVYGSVILGDRVDVGHNCSIREETQIGDYCRILPGTSVRSRVQIGKGCRLAGVLGDRSTLHPYATSLGFLVHESLVGITGEVEPAPILETGSIVGRGATVVGGVRVGEFAIVGAGAIVRKDIEPYAIVAGNPARIVGHRAAKDIERVKERILQEHYL